ncbi:MAG: YihY/virulence factor BrkB family protein [Candidatus Nomurabacteria bacterium]|nr:MAG: YihY/virulence factor BrkB family protein [Candidatus Nomurabacteria bacterium]
MQVISLLTNSAKSWYESDMKSYAAAFSYYAPLAIIPILLFSITMVGTIYSESITRQILTGWAGVLGDDIVELIKIAITNLRIEAESFHLPIFGIVLSLGISILALNALSNGFHKLWNVHQFGLHAWFKKSLRSVLFILIFQIYLAVVIGFEFFMIVNNLQSDYILSLLFLFISTGAFFAILFRFLASHSPSWKGCLVGALVASLLFIVTKSSVNIYVIKVANLNIYGTAGLILVLLLWVYILAALIYYGAAIAYEYDKIKAIRINSSVN